MAHRGTRRARLRGISTTPTRPLRLLRWALLAFVVVSSGLLGAPSAQAAEAQPAKAAAYTPIPRYGVGAQRTVTVQIGGEVRCLTSAGNHAIWALNDQTPYTLVEVTGGTVVGTYKVPVSPLNIPSGNCLVVGPDGNLWFDATSVTATGITTPTDVMVRFNVHTHAFTVFPIQGAQAGISQISAGPAGVWFTEIDTHQLGLITPAGTITQFAPGAISVNSAVLALPNGDVWYDATENSTEELVEMTSAGTVLARDTGVAGVTVLAIGPDGRLWVSDNAGLGELTAPNKVAIVWGSDIGPQAMAVGPDGSMWFVSAWFGCLTSQNGVVSAAHVTTVWKAPGCAGSIISGSNDTMLFTAQTGVIFEAAATPTAFGSPGSAITKIPSPFAAFADPARAVVNVSITLIAMLALTFPSQLFNHTFEENYEEIVAISRRRFSWLTRLRERAETAPSRGRDAIAFVAVVLLGSFLGALRDPQFGLNGHSGSSFAATLLSIGATTAIAYWVARTYRTRNHIDTTARLHALPAGLLIAGLCVVVSRVARFEPGYLYGVITGVAFGTSLRKDHEGRLITLSTVGTLAVAVAAWFIWVPVHHAATGHSPLIGMGLFDDFLASIFVGTITGTVISMLPLRFMPGHTLFRWHRGAWAAVFGVSTFLLVEVLLRPANGTSHPGDVTWVTALALFAIFGLGSLGFREYFDRRIPEDHGRIGLGAAVIRALWDHDGLSERQLAVQLNVAEGHVATTVARLERAHWLAHDRDAGRDDDEVPLHLSAAGGVIRTAEQHDLTWLRRRRLLWGLTPADAMALGSELTVKVSSAPIDPPAPRVSSGGAGRMTPDTAATSRVTATTPGTDAGPTAGSGTGSGTGSATGPVVTATTATPRKAPAAPRRRAPR